MKKPHGLYDFRMKEKDEEISKKDEEISKKDFMMKEMDEEISKKDKLISKLKTYGCPGGVFVHCKRVAA